MILTLGQKFPLVLLRSCTFFACHTPQWSLMAHIKIDTQRFKYVKVFLSLMSLLGVKF